MSDGRVTVFFFTVTASKWRTDAEKQLSSDGSDGNLYKIAQKIDFSKLHQYHHKNKTSKYIISILYENASLSSLTSLFCLNKWRNYAVYRLVTMFFFASLYRHFIVTTVTLSSLVKVLLGGKK